MASAIVIVISCLVLLGWALNIPLLKTPITGGGIMRANAALGLLLAGISLSLMTRRRLSRRTVRIARACTAIVGAIGLLTLLQYATGRNFGIDELLFRDPFPEPPLYPGRPGLPAAKNLSLISVALWLASDRNGSQNRPSFTRFTRAWIAQSLAAIVGVISLQALMVRAYGLPFASLFNSHITAMGTHTALAFGILAIGVLALKSDQGWMQTVTSDGIGSMVARRFLPIAIVLPLLLGWLVVRGKGVRKKGWSSSRGIWIPEIVPAIRVAQITGP